MTNKEIRRKSGQNKRKTAKNKNNKKNQKVKIDKCCKETTIFVSQGMRNNYVEHFCPKRDIEIKGGKKRKNELYSRRI